MDYEQSTSPWTETGTAWTLELTSRPSRILLGPESTRWMVHTLGFPCSTFSRLRFREQPGMPGPVRDLEHMRGLPSNTPAQQKEADVGWLLAARSATFMDAVRCSARERSVQAVATLENPLPSGPPYPSAFFVDEVAAFLQDEESEAAEFNSCIYGMLNWKLARWAGALRGLASLSGRCKCKVPHERIIGKKASAAAAR